MNQIQEKSVYSLYSCPSIHRNYKECVVVKNEDLRSERSSSIYKVNSVRAGAMSYSSSYPQHLE